MQALILKVQVLILLKGLFSSEIILEYMEKFKLSLKLNGTANTFSKEKLLKKRGVECSKEDF